jgi:HEAT repeat protein
MGFYDLSKEEREKLVTEIEEAIKHDLESGNSESIQKYVSNIDTYIRKKAYLIIGRLHRDRPDLREGILNVLEALFTNEEEKVRQTVVYALGEIGKIDADKIFGMLKEAFMRGRLSNSSLNQPLLLNIRIASLAEINVV